MAEVHATPYQASIPYFRRALEEITRGSDPVTFALLSHRDGRPITMCSAKDTTIPPAKLAAMTSAVAALSATILREVSQDQQAMTLIEGRSGLFLVMPVHGQAKTLLLGTHASMGHPPGKTHQPHSHGCSQNCADSQPPKSLIGSAARNTSQAH